MIETCKKIELLAPAKDKECAFAAIKAGADAVYMGASSFGARKKAGNSLDDIREVVKYAHKFNVKIYITLNTILFDNEVIEVEKLVWNLYEIGVDAIIFQDFSFFDMNLPPIALHASTQCNNDSLEKIKFLKEMNVERVVLPREVSMSQIKEVINNVDIETEVFVHGALCVSYSGQCYLSNYIGGRSANRGECAQPCRKKYSMLDDKGNVILKPQYLLSMKDNNMSAHLNELLESGVTSLKIEGRLKDKEYVANVTAYYRKLLDSISPESRPSIGNLSCGSFIPDVNKTFNRTYTDFFFDGQRKIFINPKTPKFAGECVGAVKSVYGRQLVLNKKFDIKVSDKLCYFDRNDEITGTTVTKIVGEKIEVLNIGDISKGTKLYRNFDSEFSKSLEQAHFERKIPIIFEISNEKFVAKTNEGYVAELALPLGCEKAQNIQKARENIQKQFSKLGDTDFVPECVKIDERFDRFLPVSQINEARRSLISLLEKEIDQNYKSSKREIPKLYPKYPLDKLNYSFNIANQHAKEFYEKCGATVIEMSPEAQQPDSVVELMKTKHCLRDFAGICLKKSPDNRIFCLQDEYGVKYPLVFDCKNCLMKILQP